MPFIKIYGLTGRQSATSKLLSLVVRLQRIALAIPELELKEKSDTTVRFINECDLRSKRVVEVEITVFHKPPRTLEIRNKLAEEVGKDVIQFTEAPVFVYINYVDRDAVGAWKGAFGK